MKPVEIEFLVKDNTRQGLSGVSGGIDGVEQALRVRLDGKEDPTVSLHCDKTVAVDEVVKVMNIAKDRNYKLILATQP